MDLALFLMHFILFSTMFLPHIYRVGCVFEGEERCEMVETMMLGG
jgi:hypothetical protein